MDSLEVGEERSGENSSFFIVWPVYKIIKYALPQPVHALIVYSDSARLAYCLLVVYNIPTRDVLFNFVLLFSVNIVCEAFLSSKLILSKNASHSSIDRRGKYLQYKW